MKAELFIARPGEQPAERGPLGIVNIQPVPPHNVDLEGDLPELLYKLARHPGPPKVSCEPMAAAVR
jgi:hypothetical protein